MCLFTIVNMAWATSGIIWLLNLDKVDTETEPIVGISILNQLLWMSAVIVPFVQVNKISNIYLYISVYLVLFLNIIFKYVTDSV